MRISADSESDYYKGEAAYHCWLDGKRVDNVIEADEENGWIIVYGSATGHWIREILRGNVRIVNVALLPL